MTSFLLKTESLVSPNQLVAQSGRYRLIMQNDGNLVLYDRQGMPRWASVTDGNGPSTLLHQTDSNLVITRNSDSAVTWSSQTNPGNVNNPGSLSSSTLVLQDDGNLVLYTSTNVVIWSTSTNALIDFPPVAITSTLQSIAPGAIIELFQLELNAAQHGVNEIYRFHAGVNADDNQSIIWAGQEYLRFPIEAEGFEYNGQGQLPRPKLRISNIFGTITAILLTLPTGIEGAKVTRIRTLARYLDAVNFPSSDILLTEDGDALLLEDGGFTLIEALNSTEDPTAEFPREVFYIDRKALETRDVIEFELAAVFDLVGVRAPKRQCVSNVCQWTYRGPECGYTGNAYFDTNNQPVSTLAQDACGKQLSSCELRFEQQQRTGSVTVGSNILTLTQASSFSSGVPVTGFGLPAGTTVSSVSGTQVTLSQNAFAGNNVATNGTIQTNYTQIVVSSATGIAVGMTVTGAYLPANCQVVGIAGTTISISPPVDPSQFFTVVGSANGDTISGQSFIDFADGTVVTIGWYVASSKLSLSRLCQITGIRTITKAVTSGKNSQVSKYTRADLSQVMDFYGYLTWTFYTFNSIPSASYTFTATNTTYTFGTNNSVPFGSFPGVGTFT